jgi:transcriptional regulator with XRE-family HTH domain
MTINEKLARWMDENRVTQAAAAAACDVAQATISGIASGATKRPKGEVIVALARMMECDLEWLLDDRKGWPMKRAKAPAGDPISDEDREILATIRQIDRYFGPGTAMRRLLGDAYTGEAGPKQEGRSKKKAAG